MNFCHCVLVPILTSSLLSDHGIRDHLRLGILFSIWNGCQAFCFFRNFDQIVSRGVGVPKKNRKACLKKGLLCNVRIFRLFKQRNFNGVYVWLFLGFVYNFIYLLRCNVPISCQQFHSLPRHVQRSLKFEGRLCLFRRRTIASCTNSYR